MLALRRSIDEEIYIGENILVKVLRVDPDGAIVLGIEAPKSVNIVRGELLTREQKAFRKRQATT